MLSRVWLFMTPWAITCQALLSIGFYRQECWSAVPLPPLRHLPYSGSEPLCFVSPALSGGFFTTSTTWEVPILYFSGRASKAQIDEAFCPRLHSKLRSGAGIWIQLRKSTLNTHWKDWCWSWSLIVWSPDGRSRCIGKDPDAGKDWGKKEKRASEHGWMASPMQQTRTWANSGRWRGTGRPGVLQSVGTLTQEPGLALSLLSRLCIHTCGGNGGGLALLLWEGFWRLQFVIGVGHRLPKEHLGVLPAGCHPRPSQVGHFYARTCQNLLIRWGCRYIPPPRNPLVSPGGPSAD